MADLVWGAIGTSPGIEMNSGLSLWFLLRAVIDYSDKSVEMER